MRRVRTCHRVPSPAPGFMEKTPPRLPEHRRRTNPNRRARHPPSLPLQWKQSFSKGEREPSSDIRLRHLPERKPSNQQSALKSNRRLAKKTPAPLWLNFFTFGKEEKKHSAICTTMRFRTHLSRTLITTASQTEARQSHQKGTSKHRLEARTMNYTPSTQGNPVKYQQRVCICERDSKIRNMTRGNQL